jgi:predicted xylose isomerase-like sugar epimerase
MLNSRISVIEGHIRDTNADSLYKPLRDTFLLDTTAKKSFLDDVSRFSHVSHSVKTHTYVENHRLVTFS